MDGAGRLFLLSWSMAETPSLLWVSLQKQGEKDLHRAGCTKSCLVRKKWTRRRRLLLPQILEQKSPNAAESWKNWEKEVFFFYTTRNSALGFIAT